MSLQRVVPRRHVPGRSSSASRDRPHRWPLTARGAVPMKPIVAVVGRPNVGKSTLVNRIVGRREAIVEERPGVTRDRKVLESEWNGREFTVIDTGGWLANNDTLDSAVSKQSERAIADADVILFVLDATVGIVEEDDRVARVVRKAGRPVLVVANKVDSDSRENDVWEMTALGMGDPWPVSALHGRGTGDLLDAMVALFPTEEPTLEGAGSDNADFGVAIV